MSATPYYFCIAALILTVIVQTVVFVMREFHHNRIQAGLIDKILEQHGLNAIPQEHPLAEIVSHLVEKKDEEPKPQRVRIPIPGMAVFQREYNRVMKTKEANK